jgi:hypothetical protein
MAAFWPVWREGRNDVRTVSTSEAEGYRAVRKAGTGKRTRVPRLPDEAEDSAEADGDGDLLDNVESRARALGDGSGGRHFGDGR